MFTPLTQETKVYATIRLELKQGVDPRLEDVKDLTFEDVMLPDGTLVKNVRFDQLVNTVWSYESKNVTTLTNEPKP